MNVATLKTVSYLSSFGLLGGIGYVGYDYYENGQNLKFFDNKETVDLLKKVTPPATQRRRGLDYKADITPAILNFDWTGAPPPPPPEIKDTTQEPVVVTATPVADILDVVAILRDSDDESGSWCLLNVTDTVQSYEDLFFRIGDSLPAPHGNIAVFAIEPESVVFSFADDERAHESVDPATLRDNKKGLIVKTDPSNLKKPNMRPFDGAKVASDTNPAGGHTVRRNGQYYIGPDDAETFSSDYQRIFSEDVSLETYYDEKGKRAGLKVRSVKAGSIAASHGVLSDDIIISINGHAVTSEQQGMQYVRQNSENTSTWRVKFIRLGAEREEVYHSPE